jgi:hypothetical protein
MLEWINSRRQLKASSSSNSIDYPRGTMKQPNQIISLLVIGIIAVISGCSHSNSTTPPIAAAPATSPALVPPYLIQPGDALDIDFASLPRSINLRRLLTQPMMPPFFFWFHLQPER